MKRFWKQVRVEHGEVRLDGRPVRTPGRAVLAVPTPALLEAIADEWRAVGETIDPRLMPLTGLANAAIDRVAREPARFAEDLARYGESDLLYYRADQPEPLVARQRAAWDPLLDWARARYDLHFSLVAGVMHAPQPAMTITRLAEAVASRTPFELAGLSPVVTITGSLIAGLALIERAADAEAAWCASQVDEDWQEEHWGADELATRARALRRAEFDAAVRFLDLLEG